MKFEPKTKSDNRVMICIAIAEDYIRPLPPTALFEFRDGQW
jgi:hypothetical protein